jgi:hypothetical protein
MRDVFKMPRQTVTFRSDIPKDELGVTTIAGPCLEGFENKTARDMVRRNIFVTSSLNGYSSRDVAPVELLPYWQNVENMRDSGQKSKNRTDIVTFRLEEG